MYRTCANKACQTSFRSTGVRHIYCRPECRPEWEERGPTAVLQDELKQQQAVVAERINFASESEREKVMEMDRLRAHLRALFDCADPRCSICSHCLGHLQDALGLRVV